MTYQSTSSSWFHEPMKCVQDHPLIANGVAHVYCPFGIPKNQSFLEVTETILYCNGEPRGVFGRQEDGSFRFKDEKGEPFGPRYTKKYGEKTGVYAPLEDSVAFACDGRYLGGLFKQDDGSFRMQNLKGEAFGPTYVKKSESACIQTPKIYKDIVSFETFPPTKKTMEVTTLTGWGLMLGISLCLLAAWFIHRTR